MSSKRLLSTSPSAQLTNINTTVTQSTNSPKLSLCLICGDKASINNYGALSCLTCKTFFRRNGFRPETVRRCIFNQCCEVNIQTRHICTACRLAKCFTMGMSSDLIRKEAYNKGKTSQSAKSDNTKQITTALPLTTSDVGQDTRLILNDPEWTLLSNILYAYDTYSIVSQVCHAIDSLSTSSIETYVNILKPLEIVSQIFISVQSFISALPDFRILTIDEQTSLFERNLHGIAGFYFMLVFRDTKILNNCTCLKAFRSVYGLEIMLLAKNATDRLDSDSTLIKLMVIIFAFSSHCFIINKRANIERDSLLNGTFRLLGSQNVYLELLWKYMIYRYGSNQSILRFSRLTQTFLCTLKTSSIIYMNNKAHQNTVDDTIKKIKQSLITNMNEQTPLWGRT